MSAGLLQLIPLYFHYREEETDFLKLSVSKVRSSLKNKLKTFQRSLKHLYRLVMNLGYILTVATLCLKYLCISPRKAITVR